MSHACKLMTCVALLGIRLHSWELATLHIQMVLHAMTCDCQRTHLNRHKVAVQMCGLSMANKYSVVLQQLVSDTKHLQLSGPKHTSHTASVSATTYTLVSPQQQWVIAKRQLLS